MPHSEDDYSDGVKIYIPRSKQIFFGGIVLGSSLLTGEIGAGLNRKTLRSCR